MTKPVDARPAMPEDAGQIASARHQLDLAAGSVGPGESIVISVGRLSGAAVGELGHQIGATVILAGMEVVGLQLANGGRLLFDTPAHRHDIADRGADRGATSEVADTTVPDAVFDFDFEAGGLLPGVPGSGFDTANRELHGSTHTPSLQYDETRHWGRDDLKRGEQGSQGDNLTTPLGSGLGHMVGLRDEEPGHRNGEMTNVTDSTRFPGETFGVGSGLDHLWLLGDTDYIRASRDIPDGEGVFEDRGRGPIIYAPLAPTSMALDAVEDTNLTGKIFDPKEAVLPVRDLLIQMDPTFGTAALNPDGTFDYVPAPGFSGIATFTYSFTDPRNGMPLVGTATLTVQAVVDDPTILGGTQTPEDSLVAVPVTVTLNDPDGSEIIEQAVISGVPVGATLSWNTTLPGTVTPMPGGSFVVSGSTSEIQDLLWSLAIDPPTDFSGTITLDVAVTVTEANVDPGLPGFGDTTTIHTSVDVDVIAVADPVTVVGDIDEVTPEDTPIRLDELAATFGDSLDGSEIHTIRILGVVAGAALTDGLGAQYPFTLAVDGTKIYTLSLADLADVWFSPPHNETGTFSGMTIVATATEPNGDQQAAQAPIVVNVTPVADHVTIVPSAASTNEDTPVTFGAGIAITINDPTEFLSQVVVSGFPIGTTLTYLAVDGTPVSHVVTGAGEKVTLTGGSETEIRTALATLTLTPPLHTDGNITLSVAATSTDLGGVTQTDTVPMTVRVDAIADAPALSGVSAGLEDLPIPFAITTALTDADGTEDFEFTRITVPAGTLLHFPATLPDGIAVSVAANVTTFTPGPATTPAQFAAFLANDLTLTTVAHSNVDFSVDVVIGTYERTPSETGEIALLRNESALSVPVTVLPVNDLPAISGASAVDEDRSVNFGANVVIPALVDADGSEAITAITVGNFPAGVAPTWTTAGTVTVGLVAGTYTISGGSEADIRATLASFSVDLSQAAYAHRDEDFTLQISVTTTDVDDAANPSAVATTAISDHIVTVNAVADTPNVAGDTKTTHEDTPVLLTNLAGSLVDTDTSETLTFEIRGVDATVQLMDGADGGTANEFAFVVAGDGTLTYTVPVGDIDSVWFHPPANVSGTFSGMSLHATATEHTIAGEPTSDDIASASAPISVVITPVADFPTISGSSVVDEDTAVLVGGDIAIGALADTDGSETISAITVAGFPVGAELTYSPVGGGAPQTITISAGTSTLVLSGGTEAEIRTALGTISMVPPPHSDANIPLSVSVTTNDSGTVSTSPAYTHVVTVNAVADAPTLLASASGSEDVAFALVLTPSLVDTDGSESYDFARVTIPSGLTLIVPAILPDGITVAVTGNAYTFAPGVATTTAQFENFLANGLQLRGDLHKDTDFTVPIKVGTIESTLTDSGLTLLRNETDLAIPVTITAVADGVTKSGSSVIIEDTATSVASSVLGADIAWSLIDNDGTEAVTGVTVAGFPVGATVSYTDMAGTPQTVIVGAGGLNVAFTGGTQAQIRAALDSLAIQAPPHSDVDFSLTVGITTLDNDGSSITQSFSHAVAVAAVADTPTLTLGTAIGNEDQSIPVSFQVGHPDNTDGSEEIRDVVISGVPAGFTLTSSVLTDVSLTANGGGSYTLSYTGVGNAATNDAGINAALANLTLTYAGGVNPRLHLDTDFDLSVAVTTIESNPAGGQVDTLTSTANFVVPVTVTAVADGVTQSGSSTIVEDVARTIGADIAYARIDNDGTESVGKVEVSAFPQGTTVAYTDVAGTPHSAVVGAGGLTVTFEGGTEAEIRAAVNSLNVTAPAQSDANFSLTVAVTTNDNDGSSKTDTYTHPVNVQAVADAPTVSASSIALNEDASVALSINADRSIDGDNSETLSVRITVPSDGAGAIGVLTATAPAGVTFTSAGNGVYVVEASGATAADREATLDAFLAGDITFTPRAQWSGVLTGTGGIRVDAISTEAANGYGADLASNNSGLDGTAGDLDTKIEVATTYIDVTVAPINDVPLLANASTIRQENTGSSAVSDPDLIIPVGARLGLTIADTDGSQGLSITLTGFPTNAQALAFGTSLSGVATSVDIPTGTVTISGSSAVDVLSVLGSLSITLADDRDQNFTIGINGTSTDSNGVTVATTPFSLSHDIVVQAVADLPTVDAGTAIKSAVDEDSGFVTYGVTTALNDTDGSETYRSVVVGFSTPGSGARPEVQFGVTAGVAFDTSVSGQVTLTGAAGDVDAAMASLQVRPGADNGEDITVTVTATSVESNPAEANSTGPGVAGTEIAVPTAQAFATFVIPVNPVPETPTLTSPAATSGAEDTTFGLGAISVTSGSADPDGSETRFLEINTSSYPTGTQFLSGGSAVGSVVTAGWLRIPESALAALDIRPPVHFSGTIDLTVRGVIVDTTSSGAATSTTPSQPLAVTVTPDADAVTPPSASVGVEDNGAVAFGARLANTATGIRLIDNASGAGNNSAAETISQVVLDFPADTATSIYTITSGAAVGSAQVAFDAGTRAYTITSTIITGAADVGALSQVDRAQAETDIRATLAGFAVEMGPTHTDVDGVVAVTARTLDVNGGLANTQDNSFNHTIRIQAVADTPTVSVVDPIVAVAEDGANIALTIDASRSADQDNSETLSVRITVPTDAFGPVGTIVGTPPAGVTLTHQGGGVYLVTATGADPATRETTLDGFLNGGGIAFDPRANWSGSLTGSNGLMIEAISTEAATGNQLAAASFGGPDGTSKTETVVEYIDILVSPTVDAPVVKGNSVGLEDTRIAIPVSVTLADKDGSESYVMRIVGGVPAGAQIYGAGGAEILPAAGIYTLTPADVAALAIQPPLHYSSALSGDITLVTETEVTDDSGATSVSATFTNNISIAVTGDADAPTTRTIHVTGDEDQPIQLGAALIAGGSITDVLVDADGSETLSLVLSGLPAGAIPTSGVAGGINYLGSGTWQVSAAAVPTLELPPVPNYSGENPYSGLTIRAVTQELDGDQAVSADWPITFAINPVINSGTVDGFSSWGLGTAVNEEQHEAGTQGVSFASAASNVLVDGDGSEAVVSYTFDLSSLIASAGIGTHLASLPGAGSGLDKIVSNYLTGTFSYDGGAGTITVQAADIGGVALAPELFFDSNHDFAIPVTALVRDTAVIGSTPVTVDKIESGSLAVNLVGDADVPTVFANPVAGASGALLPVSLGGDTTDTDVALGRLQSEEIYYIVSTLNPGSAPAYGFADSSGSVLGLDNGDGTWLLRPADLAVAGGLHIRTQPGVTGTASLRITTVAVENDGDLATNSADFDVTVTSGPGTAGTAPLPPQVTVGANAGNEDAAIVLQVSATPAPGDTTNPTVAVMISDLPPGAQVIGATLNPVTGRYVASAAAVMAGLVQIVPPLDHSGPMPFTIEAVATNASLLKATTGEQIVSMAVDPVADGVTITAPTGAGLEDVGVALNIGLTERDTDGNEDIAGISYVALSDGATLVGGYGQVGAGDADAFVEGTSMVGFYRVPTTDLATLSMLPAAQWHGSVTVTVAARSIEPLDDNDGDNVKLDVSSFQVPITAVADAPTVTVPVAVAGTEDTSIAIPGLSAALVDLETANGVELLSVKLGGIPEGSLLNAGSNNGDGSWTVPVAALAALAILPPEHYAGTMTLTLTAIALELSNGSEAQTALDFTLDVAPVADAALLLARDVTLGATGLASLDLNLRMDDNRGSTPGELGPELVTLAFSSLPTGVFLVSSLGGTIADNGGGTWTFVGTEAQANALQVASGPGVGAGVQTIGLSAVTTDGGNTLAVPITDSFRLTVSAPSDAGQTVSGTGAANTLNGGAGNDILDGMAGNDNLSGGGGIDRLVGGTGADTMAGGAGADVFVWNGGDLTGDTDSIADFAAGAGGDQLDLSASLTGFDPQSSALADFVQLTEIGGDTRVSVDADGSAGGASFVDAVILENVGGLDLAQLRANGNLIV